MAKLNKSDALIFAADTVCTNSTYNNAAESIKRMRRELANLQRAIRDEENDLAKRINNYIKDAPQAEVDSFLEFAKERLNAQ